MRKLLARDWHAYAVVRDACFASPNQDAARVASCMGVS
jgi:hypothetical protein